MLKHKIDNQFIHIALRLLSNNTLIQIVIVHTIMQFAWGPLRLCNSGPTKKLKKKYTDWEKRDWEMGVREREREKD